MLSLSPVRRRAPGLILSVGVTLFALLAELLQQYLLGAVVLDGLVIAIVAGIGVHSVFGLAERFRSGVQFAAKTVLEVAIVLLGGTISAGAVMQIGPIMVAAVALVVLLSLASSYCIGRALGLEAGLATLVACGNSICGNSAIMATAPVIKAPDADVAAAIAFTAALGVLVVLLLPLGFGLIGMGQWQYGVIAGLSVYAVPQVLAATVPVGVLSTQIGTLVKLIRVLMLGPVLLALGVMQKGGIRSAPPLTTILPWFILGFLVMMGMRSLDLLPPVALPALESASAIFTLISMAALGLSVDLRSVIASGGRVLAAGFLSIAMLILLATATALILA